MNTNPHHHNPTSSGGPSRRTELTIRAKGISTYGCDGEGAHTFGYVVYMGPFDYTIRLKAETTE